MGRQGTLAPSNGRYFNLEVWANTLKRFLFSSDTVEALGVVIMDDQGNQVSATAGTGTVTSVADSASSQTLLAANTSRKGCIIHNDSTVVLYIKFGTTASATSFTVRLVPQGSYEMSGPIYTGIITGIWASDASGAARVTELT